jgi:hypothetical protein
MKDVFFEGTIAEDALNIVEAVVEINQLRVEDTYSDGFDCDYCRGSISNSTFYSIGGDGLDFSGSDLQLKNISFRKVVDKAFSVGEASSVVIHNSEMRDVGVGIAVKDGSSASIQGCSIVDYKLFAAMTYSKKNHYDGYSSLILEDCRIEGGLPSFASQEGTFLSVDGGVVLKRDVDVEGLYSSGVMKKR